MTIEAPECRYCREQWAALSQRGITLAALQTFYARYKYLIMSRHLASYHEIGALLANVNKKDLPAVAQRLLELMLNALALPASRGGNVNALLHIAGYLKTQLSPTEKHALINAVEAYGRGDIEFEIPVTILCEAFQRFPNAYIEQQVFLLPHIFKSSPLTQS